MNAGLSAPAMSADIGPGRSVGMSAGMSHA
jgi:hypothetical protein